MLNISNIGISFTELKKQNNFIQNILALAEHD
jgi:hypothetical protein